MMLYYCMNDSAQFLDSNYLWQNTFDKANMSSSIPDPKNVGVFKVFEIEEEKYNPHEEPSKHILASETAHLIVNKDVSLYYGCDYRWHNVGNYNKSKALMLLNQEIAAKLIVQNNLKDAIVFHMRRSSFEAGVNPNPLDFVNKYGAKHEVDLKPLVDAGLVDSRRFEDFKAAFKELTAKFKPVEFKPYCFYNKVGDQLEVYLTDEVSHQKPVSVKSPGIMLQIGIESKEITGIKIQSFLERLSADPSVQYMPMDLDFIYTLCDLYQKRRDEGFNFPEWTVEELRFFRTVIRLWPGLEHKFLHELAEAQT